MRYWLQGSVLLGLAGLTYWRISKPIARGSNSPMVPGGKVTSKFGHRELPKPEFHQGVDIAAPLGTEIRCAEGGVVVDVAANGTRDRYGNVVIVEHADGSLEFHAHMSGFAQGIKVGRLVKTGDVLGYVGNTHAPSSVAMAPHDHFEILTKKLLWKGQVVVNADVPARLDPVAWAKSKDRQLV